MPDSTTQAQHWLYSIANLGNTIPGQAVGAFMLSYYTDHKQLPAAWAATAMLVYSIYDAVNNPILDYLSDRTRTRWGRRTPYIMFGAAPYVLAFAFLVSRLDQCAGRDRVAAGDRVAALLPAARPSTAIGQGDVGRADAGPDRGLGMYLSRRFTNAHGAATCWGGVR